MLRKAPLFCIICLFGLLLSCETIPVYEPPVGFDKNKLARVVVFRRDFGLIESPKWLRDERNIFVDGKLLGKMFRYTETFLMPSKHRISTSSSETNDDCPNTPTYFDLDVVSSETYYLLYKRDWGVFAFCFLPIYNGFDITSLLPSTRTEFLAAMREAGTPVPPDLLEEPKSEHSKPAASTVEPAAESGKN